MVASHLYSITVVLVSNLQTGNIIPQFHLVFDQYFETVNPEEYLKTPFWSELITFNYFNSAYDDEEYGPKLSDEWLYPEALEYRGHQVS